MSQLPFFLNVFDLFGELKIYKNRQVLINNIVHFIRVLYLAAVSEDAADAGHTIGHTIGVSQKQDWAKNC